MRRGKRDDCIIEVRSFNVLLLPDDPSQEHCTKAWKEASQQSIEDARFSNRFSCLVNLTVAVAEIIRKSLHLSTFCCQFSDGDTEYSEDEEDFDTPQEADRVYVLMKKDYRLSRNSRAKWYLKHLIPRQHGQAANTATPGVQDADRGDNFKIRKYQSIEDMPR